MNAMTSGKTDEVARLPRYCSLRTRYIIREFLGEGGLAYNYVACLFKKPKEKVVIKQTKRFQGLTGVISEDRFQMEREFRFLLELDSTAIPCVYEMFEIDDVLYLVREYRDGVMLDELIGLGLSREAIENLCWQIMDVLEYLHERGIIYRDIKPGNLLVDTNGNIFLLDFGTARFHKNGKKSDTIALGTPGFAPPEQYGLSQTTPASDIYSFGALLYYMLTGENPEDNPFGICSPDNIHAKIREPYIAEFLIRCLMLDPKKRFQTINEARIMLFDGGAFRLPPSRRERIYEICCGKELWGWIKGARRTIISLLILYLIFSVALFNLANIYNWIEGGFSIMTHAIEYKVTGFSVKRHKVNVDHYLTEANRSYLGKRYSRALISLDKAIKKRPTSAYAHFLRSRVYADLKKYDLAIVEIDRVIELEPRNRTEYLFIRSEYIFKQVEIFNEENIQEVSLKRSEE